MKTRCFAVLGLLVSSPAFAQAYGPDTCAQGFVWREAFSGDHVCVTAATREQTALDNRMAAERREPGGGAYGPDTCRAGFVWREARPEDHVCVAPETRAQVASDNALAASRRARLGGAVTFTPEVATGVAGAGVVVAQPGTGARAEAAAVADTVPVLPPPIPAPLSAAPRSEGGSVRRGFDENGRPYVEETLRDGTIRREGSNRITITWPDGTRKEYRNDIAMVNVQYATPPALPSDPAQGRDWMSWHNERLLQLIKQLVNNSAAEMRTFSASERQAVGDDLFQQIEFRTNTLDVLTLR